MLLPKLYTSNVLKLLFITYIFCSYNAYSQRINLTGKIINNSTNIPVGNVTVQIYKSDKVIYTTSADTLGKFIIPIYYLDSCTHVKFHSIGFEDLTLHKKRSYDNLKLIRLKPSTIILNEVSIKSKKRYRDTTKIDLSQKKFERSVMIDDLFSQNMGFTKDGNGRLYYKGNLVSDLLVNGSTFFGKNNMDIYQLVPALILNGIDIVQTNIDSVTNTTTLRPSIKVNLRLKEKYRKGVFGNANLGAGTSDRYIANGNLYTYKENEQISVSLNSNNLNLPQDFILEPIVSFSSNGNNQNDNILKFTYRNIYVKKVEVNFNVTGNAGDKNFLSETQLKYETESLSIDNYSRSNFAGLKNSQISITYKIDSLNTLNFIQSFNYNYNKQLDSLNYKTLTDTSNNISDLNQSQKNTNTAFSNKVLFQKKIPGKKPKFLNVNIEFDRKNYDITEANNVTNINNQLLQYYFINDNRTANENIITATADLTLPLDETSYVKLFTNYKRDNVDYKTNVNSDTISNVNTPAIIKNGYFQSGIALQKTFNKLSLDWIFAGILDDRIVQSLRQDETTSFNANLDIKVDYKLNNKKSLLLNFLTDTWYPTVVQLTNINSTFDLTNQIEGNPYLKPELAKTAHIDYKYKISDNESLTLSAVANHYSSAFGYNVSSGPENIQYQNIANVGNSSSGSVGYSLVKSINGHSLFYSGMVGYQQFPEIINDVRKLNNSLNFNQSFTTPITISSFASTSPILSASLTRYYYGILNSQIFTLTYSDKILFTFSSLKLSLYPLLNFNHSISNNTSWSMNAEIQKTIFKKFGYLWLQAYDIFNSFRFFNNYLGANYIQSTKYSNIGRYFIVGISFKLNNMK